MAFPASLLSTLPGCRDPHTFNGLDYKQSRSSLPGGLRSGQRVRVGREPLTQTTYGAREACSGPGPTHSPNCKADPGARETSDIWGRKLDQVLEKS